MFGLGARKRFIIAGAAAKPGNRTLALLGGERVGHLGFQHLLHHRPDDLAQPIGALGESSLTAAIAGLPSVLVMAVVLPGESGDWTSSACHDRLLAPQRFCRTFSTLL